MKAEYESFCLRYWFFQCMDEFFLNFEIKDFQELTITPCTANLFQKNSATCVKCQNFQYDVN